MYRFSTQCRAARNRAWSSGLDECFFLDEDWDRKRDRQVLKEIDDDDRVGCRSYSLHSLPCSEPQVHARWV
jgi:hypothetical protein